MSVENRILIGLSGVGDSEEGVCALVNREEYEESKERWQRIAENLGEDIFSKIGGGKSPEMIAKMAMLGLLSKNK